MNFFWRILFSITNWISFVNFWLFFSSFWYQKMKKKIALGVQINHFKNRNLQVNINSYDPKSCCNILLCKAIDYSLLYYFQCISIQNFNWKKWKHWWFRISFLCILYSLNSFQFYPNDPIIYEKYCYISTPNIFNVNLTCHLKTCKID